MEEDMRDESLLRGDLEDPKLPFQHALVNTQYSLQITTPRKTQTLVSVMDCGDWNDVSASGWDAFWHKAIQTHLH